jgi:tryptophan synthase alpha subunit
MSTTKTLPLMAHMVIGYPTLENSYQTAIQYIKAGVRYLEMQIPFSHPTADGPVITDANRMAIEQNNVTISDCLELIDRLIPHLGDTEIVIMTYCNKALSIGAGTFAEALTFRGINKAIIPDLPFDDQLVSQFKGLTLVPVIAPNITASRLNIMLDKKPSLVYIMADFKITGSVFGVNEAMNNLVQTIKKNCDAQVGIGFGISNAAQAKEILKLADFAIVGSALIKANLAGQLDTILADFKTLA